MTVEEILEAAARKGYVVGISDHASPEDKIVHDAHLLAYLDALERYPVYRAVEMDVELGADLSSAGLARLDYVIVGIHFLTMDGIQTFFWDPLATIDDPEKCRGCLRGHRRARHGEHAYGHLRPPDASAIWRCAKTRARLWTAERIGRLVRAAVRNHVALEISGHWEVPSRARDRRGAATGRHFCPGQRRPRSRQRVQPGISAGHAPRVRHRARISSTRPRRNLTAPA